MDVLAMIAERKIQEALARGDYDVPTGQGAQELEDLRGVPDDYRASYLVLRNSGFVPEEVELKRGIRSIETLLLRELDDGRAADLRRELREKELRYQLLMDRRRSSFVPRHYRDRVVDRVGRRPR